MSKIFVDQVDLKTATTLTLGTTGDTVSIPTGVTLSGAGTITASAANLAASGAGGVTGTLPIANGGTGAATLAAAGLTNAPSFHAEKSVVQSIAHNTTTKLTFDTEIWDSDSAYDGTSKFTPGVAGKYILILQVMLSNATDNAYVQSSLYKNGAELNSIAVNLMSNGAGATQDTYSWWSYTVDSNATDYFECYVRHNSGGALNTGTKQGCYFTGNKLIGV